MEQCGIYKLTNKTNGHLYIGQSVDIWKRWREHKHASLSPSNKDYNMVIHRAIRKYGADNFELEVIELCAPEDLNDREIYWVDYYDSYRDGYNASKGGNNYTHLGVPIEAYDLDGNYIRTYSNMKEAARDLNAYYPALRQVVLGGRKSCKGLQLKRADDTRPVGKYCSRQGGKIPVEQRTMDDDVISVYESSYEAARAIDGDPSAITKCCKGKLKSHRGFKWGYIAA